MKSPGNRGAGAVEANCFAHGRDLACSWITLYRNIILYHLLEKPMPTPVKVKKWGSSMAVLIPSQFAKMHEIDIGTVIDLEPVKVLKPRRHRYKLSQLMAKFKPRHRQGEWDVGAPVGKELW
jgi:antitoxin component of MazEF toxin-antitoxin module